MWDLVGNPEDRFSHNEAHSEVVKMNQEKIGNDSIVSLIEPLKVDDGFENDIIL